MQSCRVGSLQGNDYNSVSSVSVQHLLTVTHLGKGRCTEGEDGDEGKQQEGNLPTPHKGDDKSPKEGGHKLYEDGHFVPNAIMDLIQVTEGIEGCDCIMVLFVVVMLIMMASMMMMVRYDDDDDDDDDDGDDDDEEEEADDDDDDDDGDGGGGDD